MSSVTFFPEEDRELESLTTETLMTELSIRVGIDVTHKSNINFSAVSDNQLIHHVALRLS